MLAGSAIRGIPVAGLVAPALPVWDGRPKALVAEFDHQVLRDETPYPFVVQTEQHKLSELGLRRLFRDGTSTSARNGRDRPRQDARTPRHDRGCGAAVFDYVIELRRGRSTGANASTSNLKATPGPSASWCSRPCSTPVGVGCLPRSYISDPEEWTNLFFKKKGGVFFFSPHGDD